MADSVGIKVEGLNKVVRALLDVGVEVEDMKQAFSRISQMAIPLYRSVTPVRSGRLRGDYRAAKSKNKALLRVGRASVPYAAPIQWGWPRRGIAPAHYVQKGDRLVEPRVFPLLTAEINRITREKGLS